MDAITALLKAPDPQASAWCVELRIWVNRLDALERPLARADRARFGGTVSRDRLITRPHRDYPHVFVL
jgi:hypothetical protein